MPRSMTFEGEDLMDNLVNLTTMQKNWCDKILEGKSRTQAVVEAYGYSDRAKASTLAYRLWKNENCRKYINQQVGGTGVPAKVCQTILDALEAEKFALFKGKPVSLGPDWNARIKACIEYFKISGMYHKNGDVEPETKEPDIARKELTFWDKYYMLTYGQFPGPGDVERFKGRLGPVAATTEAAIRVNITMTLPDEDVETIEYLPTVPPKFVDLKPSKQSKGNAQDQATENAQTEEVKDYGARWRRPKPEVS
ncbi:hypothetical protein MYX84_13880 [Acidobacteria bacterium AH-259-O06]|nr:hypothetical protein [Acidobacteria bacterium AH-259-O06]